MGAWDGLPVESGSDEGPGSGLVIATTAGVIPSGPRGMCTLRTDLACPELHQLGLLSLLSESLI